MANFTKAYTIAFESDKEIFSESIITFLKKVELLIDSKNIVRQVNNKLMRAHAYEWSKSNADYLVVPFGKLKETNKPYGIEISTQKLIDIPMDMFDVNNLAYHSKYNIALITSNQSGPSEADIEQYLNSYLPKDAAYRIKITPIKYSTGIEKIRNAIQARSVSIVLNLGRPLDDFFKGQVQEEYNVHSYLKGLLNYSKDSLESTTFTFTLGLGHKKNATLDITALLELLEFINLDSGCVKEVYVNYKDNTSTKIDTAKLKETNMILKIYFSIKDTRLGVEYLRDNIDTRLQEDRTKYYTQVKEHFKSTIVLEGGYDFIEEFEGGPVV